MTDQELILRLWDTGHFSNPDFPETHDVQVNDLLGLNLDDSVVERAVQSYQEFFQGTLDELSLHVHGRPAEIDGDVGPATRDLIARRRCAVPDFADRQEGNWPQSCRNEITTAFKMNLRGNIDVRELWLEMIANWNGALADVTLSLDESANAMNTARIHAADKPLPGSTLAWSYLAMSDCNFRAEQAYDNTITWTEKLLVATMTHEVGHALGLEHQRDAAATMYPSITNESMNRRGFPNATDLRACTKLGYQVADNPQPKPPGPPTPPDQPDAPAVLNGAFQIRQPDGTVQRFLIIQSAFN